MGLYRNETPEVLLVAEDGSYNGWKLTLNLTMNEKWYLLNHQLLSNRFDYQVM